MLQTVTLQEHNECNVTTLVHTEVLNSNMVDVCFSKLSRYVSAVNLYMLTIEVDEIWFVDKF